MCLKLDDGAVLFSSRDMLRLRSRAAGAMGSTTWVGRGDAVGESGPCVGSTRGGCSCAVPCAECARAKKQDGE